ncbi:dihydroneopterin aldolase [Halothiobacillus sp.]|uniref:dihydroneopterin aldolase n=1 Tax=Halothiobacillus sp. TaxID=1891311 RepID=UPI00261DA9AE|nr:dihydroneopterin aldolase [Halothiobacillus sp.]
MSSESLSAGDWDWIVIDQLEFDAIIGIYPHEREQVQPLRMDIRLGVAPIHAVAKRDDISTTVDYQRVCETVMALVQAGAFNLVETLAQRCVDALFAAFPIQAIQLSVSKPLALPYTRGVGVEIFRRRPVVAFEPQ